MECKSCGAQISKKLYDAAGSAALQGSAFFKCSVCGLVSIRPRLDEIEIQKYYEQSYRDKDGRRFKYGYEIIEKYFRILRAGHINNLKNVGKILDIGCGRAIMLSRLNTLGWEAHGCELNEKTAAAAGQDKRLHIYSSAFEHIEFRDNYFDVISMWHALEHVAEPKTYLHKIRRILKEDGLLIIETPNIDSVEARLFSQNWFHLDAPRHYHLFSPQTLNTMLEEAGFYIKRTGRFSLEYAPFGVTQSVFNAMGFGHNLLYSLTMKDKIRPARPAAEIQIPLIYPLFPFVLVFGFFFAVFEAMAGKGGTVRIEAARKI